MTRTSPSTHVVVGIDGTPAAHRGVRFAAFEARDRGVTLTIVHVTPGYAPSEGVPVVPAEILNAHGNELLEHARKSAHMAVPKLEVETQLVTGGTTVSGLVESSHEAALVVLGAEKRSFSARVWTGDVVAGVAARASCPVVVVPPEWEQSHRYDRIVVGIKDPERAAALVDAGMREAHRLKAELVVLHAWKLPSGYDDIVANRVDREDFARLQTAFIEPLVLAQRVDHPHVPVRIEVLHAQPAHALVLASAHADRILVERPKHGGSIHHLGGTGRAVLQESRCPVEVHARAE